ncbi:MAG: M13 family metallopeptidase [Acidobacteriota bacterium]|jgi:predicted metalloendopeptidase
MKLSKTVPFLLLAGSILLASCAGGGSDQGEGDSLTQEEIASKVATDMDMSADPCQDFYQYACGGWLETTELPADQRRWTRSFSVIREENREAIREMIEEAAADPGDSADAKRIGDYYSSCMDEEAVNAAGATPLDPLFAAIDGVKDAASLLAVDADLQRKGGSALFGLGVLPDFKDPDLNVAFFVQGGLGMPDRDYYVSDDEKKKELLAAYRDHVERMFTLLGDPEDVASKKADDVLAVETELAKASRDRVAMRQVEKLYNKLDISGLQKLTPSLPWNTFLAETGYPDVVDINVATPEFFESLEALVKNTDPAVLQNYLDWNTLNTFANRLSQEFVDANFDFYGKKLGGQEEIEPRWKRCVDSTQNAMGEAVGRVYVERKFAGNSKQVALTMIDDLFTAFENGLPGLSWMDDTTRQRAVEKEEAIGNKIGYPDKWRDYSSMTITPDSYFDNSVAAIEFEFDRQAKKIGNPVDPDEWGMTPQQVNAYYNPLLNEIVFPAGILQPPFFHKDFPAAMNYGGIGGVIGHELTHGFDDQGRKFAPDGQLREWWEPEVAEKFQEQAQCVSDLYSGFEVEPGVNVNGDLTLGENIADIGGLKEAYAAYKLWEARNGNPEPFVEGLTNEQLFFVAWSQVWCTVGSDEYFRLQVTTDPHSPGQFRAVGPVTQHPAFAEAFACEPDTPMNPAEKCQVW